MNRSFLKKFLLSSALCLGPVLASDIIPDQEPLIQDQAQAKPNFVLRTIETLEYIENLKTRPTPTCDEILKGLESIKAFQPHTYLDAMDLYRPTTVLHLVNRDLDYIIAKEPHKASRGLEDLIKTGLFCLYFQNHVAKKVLKLHESIDIIINYQDFFIKVRNIAGTTKKAPAFESSTFPSFNEAQRKFLQEFTQLQNIGIEKNANLNKYNLLLEIIPTFFDFFKKEDISQYDNVFGAIHKINIRNDTKNTSLIVPQHLNEFFLTKGFDTILNFGGITAFTDLWEWTHNFSDTHLEKSFFSNLTAAKIWGSIYYMRTAMLYQKLNVERIEKSNLPPSDHWNKYLDEYYKLVTLGCEAKDPLAISEQNEIEAVCIKDKIAAAHNENDTGKVISLALTLPNDARIQITLGRIYQEDKNYEEALKWYKKCVNNLNVNKIIRLNSINEIGEIYFKQKKYKLSKKYFIQAKKEGFIPAHRNLIELYIFNKDLNEAKKYAEELLGQKNFFGNVYLGMISEIQEDNKTAAQYYEKAIEEGSIESLNKLAHLRLKENKRDEALSLWDQYIAKGGTSCFLTLFGLHYLRRDFEKAEHYIKKAISFNDPDAEEFYAAFLKGQGREEEAKLYEYKKEEKEDSVEDYSALSFMKPVSYLDDIKPQDKNTLVPESTKRKKRIKRDFFIDSKVQDILKGKKENVNHNLKSIVRDTFV